MRTSCLSVFIIVAMTTCPLGLGDHISHNTVKSWARKLGFELSQVGKYITRGQELRDSYRQAEVKPRDGDTLVRDIAKDVSIMMESKISAVRRIMDTAEESAQDAPNADPPKDYVWINAKNNSINSLNLTYSSHFGGQVNLSRSAVHVPTNVYAGAQNVIRAIRWSEKLDHTFADNYAQDPSLSWQYFGSATGFMRQYPAMSWSMESVDLFDCRTRSWYIEAASSPKDVLILVDNSGSMTGMRKEIAKHVVNDILDTLGNNDFVNIFTFSNETTEIVDCFKDTLVQANLVNVRELKNGMETFDTDQIANFSLALNYAFELLESYRTVREGARCNQAIMLVTDGVPYNYKDIFQNYNWRENPEDPDKADMPVRIFTYLIGREVADVREVKWMACANRGYYVHLSTHAEVREQVLNYVPVMARPLVLQRTDHPTIWTPVYADIADPKMTDWLWRQTECAEQKERVQNWRKNKKLFGSKEERDRRYVEWQKKLHDQHGDLHKYKLMTSVSMPVFNRRENGNITEQVLVNEAYWVTETRETRIADLLGVAGTDVPVQEIQRLMLPHMLGVNGYAFVVTNNGYLLIHPDLRPVFQGILKPGYSSVDMAEVELMDSGNGPREFETGLLTFRNAVINQVDGNVELHTKYHYDDMKRVGRVRRKYHYKGIDHTPFTVVVALPEHEIGGSYRVHATEEIHRSYVKGKDVTDYFSGNNWRVHPDWMYCRYHYEGEHNFNSSERQLLHFLGRTRQPGWKWIDMKQRSQPPEYSAAGSGANAAHPSPGKTDKNSYYCDRNLLLSLVFDAKVTEWFANTSTTREEKGPLARLMNLLPRKEFQQRFGFTLVFVATHSGLTRWQDFSQEEGPPPEDHFSKLHPKAIDEVWYKRAVEQHYVQADSFVFSVPIDERGAHNATLVTASQAIFIEGDGKIKAPVAVVGFQFQHSALQGLFRNITGSCEGIGTCEKTCEDESLACYLLDNNGYIIAAESPTDAGKFFGDVRGPIMWSLVEEGIYDKIRIYDYQAVCFNEDTSQSDASSLLRPWESIERAASWVLGQLAWSWAQAGIWSSDFAEAHDDYSSSYDGLNGDNTTEEKKFEDIVPINRTKPQTCDQETNLYLLNNVSARLYDIDYDSSKGCERPYVVQPVDSSNMVLVVVYTMCPKTDEYTLSIVPEKINYRNMSLRCLRVVHSLDRRRPKSCIRNHTKESEIKDLCGGSPRLGFASPLLVLPVLILIFSFPFHSFFRYSSSTSLS